MTWGTPAAAWALVALAVPILIHTLVRRRARPTPFPTLRFIPSTRLASIERRALEDVWLLVLRLGALTAAIAAVASPFAMTRSRQAAWDAVTIRAEVVSGTSSRGDANRSFSADTLSAGLRDALAWFDTQPPARRELIVRSAFPIGSLSHADITAIPADIGIRLERTGTLPTSNRFAIPPVLASDAHGASRLIQREALFDGDRTSVHDIGTSEAEGQPIEIIAPASRRASADETLRSVLANRVPAPIQGRAARIELVDKLDREAPLVGAISTPWIAAAVARIRRDASHDSFDRAGVRFADEHAALVVRADATIGDATLANVIRLVLAATAPDVEQPKREILPLSDALLKAWSREPGHATAPVPNQRPRDGRWFWLMSLALLAIEALVRRRPLRTAAAASTIQEQTRVA